MGTSRGKIRGQHRGRSVGLSALDEIRSLLGDSPKRRDLLIEYLHRIQDHHHHISAAHIVALASELKLAATEVYEVATFYHHFDVVKEGEIPPPPLTVRVCESLTCEMFDAHGLHESLQNRLAEEVRVRLVPCVGRCHSAPVAVVGSNPIEHANFALVQAAVEKDETVQPHSPYVDYDDYRQAGGYETLQRCMAGDKNPKVVVEMLKASGLRGLGGAGFPVGVKWEILRKQPAPKIVAVNIDEGEPGTFKDRVYLERDPHRFLEGSLIAAWAIDADQIYVYLRDEYAGCREVLERELTALRTSPPCDLPEIHLRRGAGAYVCGEESAMIESIEGKRGMPRLRPPYVAEIGLFGRPTLEHNMETLHWVRDLIELGTDWFTDEGRHGRQGLRSFSVSGRVRKPGVHLAPAGITVLELINEYCDGMSDGHEFYGYFPGGASGGILPARMGDLPLDFDTLNDTGTFIGSAAVIILSQQDSVRRAAQNAMRFFEDESCGQCTPCRVGTTKAVALMATEKWDRPLLEDLARVMEDASICGLGQAAPNAMRCALKYFPEEFDEPR